MHPQTAEALDRWLGPAMLWRILAAHLAIGLAAVAAWQATGSDRGLIIFHRDLGAAVLVFFAAAEVGHARAVREHYQRGEPLRASWWLLSLAATSRAGGAFLAHVLPRWAGGDALRQFSLKAIGPLTLVLLALGLWGVIRVYRRLGLAGRISPGGAALIIVVGAVTAAQFSQFPDWARSLDAWPGISRIGEWLVDPLLLVLAAQAALLSGSIQPLREGMLARCWGSYCLAIGFTSMGNLSQWMDAQRLTTWPGSAIPMMVWYAAACCYALGPAWQHRALRLAGREDQAA